MKRGIWLLVGMLMLPAFGGCEKDGPAERAGEKVDEAGRDIKNATEDAANRAEDAAD